MELSSRVQERCTVEAAELQLGCFGNLRVVLADGAGVGGVVVRFHQPPEQVGSASFAGKFFLFFGAMAAPGRLQFEEQGGLFRVLALIGALNAAVGAYYYLRIIAVMYLRGAVKPLHAPPRLSGLLALWLCAGLTIWLGVYPWPTLRLAREAASPATPPVRVAGR